MRVLLIKEMLDQDTLLCCSITKHEIFFLLNLQEGKVSGEGLELLCYSKVLAAHMSSNIRIQVCSADSQLPMDGWMNPQLFLQVLLRFPFGLNTSYPGVHETWPSNLVISHLLSRLSRMTDPE